MPTIEELEREIAKIEQSFEQQMAAKDKKISGRKSQIENLKTKQKIVWGGAILAYARAHPGPAKDLIDQVLAPRIRRAYDRKTVGLPPLEEKGNEQ